MSGAPTRAGLAVAGNDLRGIGRLPRRSLAPGRDARCGPGVLPGAFHGERRRIRGARSPSGRQLPTRCGPRWGAPHHLSRRARRRSPAAVDTSQEPRRNRAGVRDSGVPTIEFRASIVIGAGSLSFEMIRALVERLPAMICPRWVDTRTQPIAIDDVLAYLRSALDLPPGHEGVFEIGGPDMVSYGDMMREYARIRGLRRLLIPVPLLTPRLSGLWLGLVTPAQARVGRALVEGLRNPTVMRSASAYETFAISPLPLREAFARAINEPVSGHHKSDTRLIVVKASA